MMTEKTTQNKKLQIFRKSGARKSLLSTLVLSLSKHHRNIDPASSTFTFETQAVFHPVGAVTTVFVVPGKVKVKIGWNKNRLKRAKIIVHSVLS